MPALRSSPKPIELLLQRCGQMCQVLLDQRIPGSKGKFEIHLTTANNTLVLKVFPYYCEENSIFFIDHNHCSKWMRPIFQEKEAYSDPSAILVDIEYKLHRLYSDPGHGIVGVKTRCVVPEEHFEVSVFYRPSHRSINQILLPK